MKFQFENMTKQSFGGYMAISVCDVHTNNNQKDTTIYGSVHFPVACYEDNMQIMSVPLHWHDEYEYIFATKGIVTVYVNTKPIELNVGDSIFINSECLHGVKSVTDEDSILRSLVILPKLIGGSTDSIISQRIIVPLGLNTAPSYILLNNDSKWQKDIAKAMLTAWNSLTNESYDFENEARYQISKAMRILVDHLSETNCCKTNDILLNRIKLSISYIETHFNEDRSNRDLMQLLGCSESVLLRSFKQVAGISPMQFLLNHRIQKAAEMLLTTELKSCDIAVSCGFHDFSYFTKIFKRTVGMTPIEYRNSNRQ